MVVVAAEIDPPGPRTRTPPRPAPGLAGALLRRLARQFAATSTRIRPSTSPPRTSRCAVHGGDSAGAGHDVVRRGDRPSPATRRRAPAVLGRRQPGGEHRERAARCLRPGPARGRGRSPGRTDPRPPRSSDQLGLHRLIALIPDTGELRSFTRDVLGQLAEPTTERHLRETLQVLLDTNFNVAEAARLQFSTTTRCATGSASSSGCCGPLSTDQRLRPRRRGRPAGPGDRRLITSRDGCVVAAARPQQVPAGRCSFLGICRHRGWSSMPAPHLIRSFGAGHTTKGFHPCRCSVGCS